MALIKCSQCWRTVSTSAESHPPRKDDMMLYPGSSRAVASTTLCLLVLIFLGCGGHPAKPVLAVKDSGPSLSDQSERRTDCQRFAQLVGEWAGERSGYITIKASREFEWGEGGNRLSGTCTFQASTLRLFPSEIVDRQKGTEKVPPNAKTFLQFSVTSMNPLVLNQEGVSLKYRGVSRGDRNRGNVGKEITPSPGGEPSVRVSRTYILRLHEGWREIYLDYVFDAGSLVESINKGHTYAVVMKTDSGLMQSMPARFTGSEFSAVFFPSTAEAWDDEQAEQLWKNVKSATFWIEYSVSKDDKGRRVSPVIGVSQPDL